MRMLLEENPIRRSKRYHPVAVDQWGNPVVISVNPGRKKRRNPMVGIPKLGKLTGGVGVMEIIGGAAGLAGSSMLPNVFIKTVPVTNGEKAIKVGVSVLSTLAVGYLFSKVGRDQRAGRAAIIGGLAGVAINVVNIVRPGTVSAAKQISGPVRRLGEAATVSPGFTREGENVTLIRP